MHSEKVRKMTTVEPTVLRRRSFMKEMGLTILVCALFLSPWNLTAWNTFGTIQIQESKTMRLAQQSSSTDRVIPPIDASAPAKTETATFAMG